MALVGNFSVLKTWWIISKSSLSISAKIKVNLHISVCKKENLINPFKYHLFSSLVSSEEYPVSN